ncbi:MAG: hypothetical protein WDA75_25945, partial [Candidatus Latescibacterota bacterium]
MIQALSVHPDNPNEFLLSSAAGNYLTTDRGQTYLKVMEGVNADLFRYPGRPNLVFAGWYRSLDGGRTWSTLPHSVQAYTTTSAAPGVLYAVTTERRGNQNQIEVSKSANDGQ